jgi:hypothetical protein
MAKRFLLVGSLSIGGFTHVSPRFVNGGYDTKQEALNACADFLGGGPFEGFDVELPEGPISPPRREVYILDIQGPRILWGGYVSAIQTG